MSNAQNYLPKHNQDTFYVEEMLALSDIEIKPIIDDLLYWMKSMNWKVTPDIAVILSKHPKAIKDKVTLILDDEKIDPIWKYNIIRYTIIPMDKENIKLFEKSLLRISNKPVFKEVYVNTDIVAKEALSKL